MPYIGKFVADPNHWAYQQGQQAGREKKTSERGLMVFGQSCAKEDVDYQNASQWLAGYDSVEHEIAPANAVADSWDSLVGRGARCQVRPAVNENGELLESTDVAEQKRREPGF